MQQQQQQQRRPAGARTRGPPRAGEETVRRGPREDDPVAPDGAYHHGAPPPPPHFGNMQHVGGTDEIQPGELDGALFEPHRHEDPLPARPQDQLGHQPQVQPLHHFQQQHTQQQQVAPENLGPIEFYDAADADGDYAGEHLYRNETEIRPPSHQDSSGGSFAPYDFEPAASYSFQRAERVPASEHVSLRGSFENSIFKPRYQRNNKRGGLKNLRCFPSCGFRHKEKGFCGRSVEIELAHGSDAPSKRFYAWVEFVRTDEAPRYQLGERVTLEAVLAEERSKDEPIRPLVRGERLNEKSTETATLFEFNRERRGWHYGWASNKHTCNAQHALQCYVFESSSQNPENLVCRLIVRSPSFMLFCRRRRRFTLMPSAPTSAPTKRARAGTNTSEHAPGSVKRERLEEENASAKTPDHQQRPQQQSASGSSGNADNSNNKNRPPAPRPPSLQATAMSSSSSDDHIIVSSMANSPTYRPPGAQGSVRVGAIGAADSSRMETVFKRLAVVMSRIQQQQQQEQTHVQHRQTDSLALASTSNSLSGVAEAPPPIDGLAPLTYAEREAAGEDAFGAYVLDEAFELFAKLPDLGEDAFSFDAPTEGYQADALADFSFAPPLPSAPALAERDMLGYASSAGPQADTGVAPTRPSAEGTDSVPAPQPLKRTISDQMMDDVAHYLRNESKFQRAVGKFTRQAHHGAPDYGGFLRMVQDYLESYRRSRNISRSQFDRAFNNATARFSQSRSARPQDEAAEGGAEGPAPKVGGRPLGAVVQDSSAGADAAGPTGGDFAPGGTGASARTTGASGGTAAPTAPKQSLLGSAFGALTSFVSTSSSASASTSHLSDPNQPLYLSGPGNARIPNIQGRWRQTEVSENLMQELRIKMGTPWILSKMFEFMESRYEIEIAGLTMIMRLNRKWIANTALRFILDGEEHPWGISLPAPFSQLSQGWTYRAWIEDHKIILTHMIGDQRVTRINWVSRDRRVLHCIVILEVQDLHTGAYLEMGRVNQHANLEP